MKTVILAGGQGTRIREWFPDVPKPLIPIAGRPVLEREICSLRDQGLSEVFLTVSYRAEQIMNYFGDGKWLGVHLEYVVEQEPLGTAGALFRLRERLGSEPFLVMNADSIYEVDLERLAAFHRERGRLVTLFVHPGDHPGDCSSLILSPDGMVQEWLTPEMTRPEWMINCVNTGLLVMDPAVLDRWTGNREGKIDLDRQILRPLCGSGQMIACTSTEYARDMGTPERYERVCRDFEHGIVQARRLRNPQRAIFIDRDGLLSFSGGEAAEIRPGVSRAIREINASGRLALAVTVSRGPEGLSEVTIRKRLETLLVKKGAVLDGVVTLPEAGAENAGVFSCLFPEAFRRYNIDPAASWMVGAEAAVQAGKMAGCRTARIGVEADGNFSGLPEFVKRICSPYR